MRLPRDLSGSDLARALIRFGHEVTRRSGSHMRLATTQGGEHHVRIPDHSKIRVGTLSAILGDVAEHLGVTRGALVEELFGRR